MPTIISQNTTWKSGETINLTSEVQVALGASLTIESGVTINGNGFQLSIYGKLYANGTSNSHITLNNLNIVSSNSDTNRGYTSLNFIDMHGGSFITPYGSNMFGDFDISNSFFDTVKGFYLILPKSPSTIIGNIFYKSEGIQISGPVLIKNNLFLDQSTNYAIESWGSGATVEANSFLSTNKVALGLRANSTTSLTAVGNYFGTSDLATINSMILDRSDSLSYSSLISNSHIDSPSNATPKFDTTPPTIAIAASSARLTIFQAATIFFTLSESSTDFTLNDVKVSGGTLADFKGSGTNYTAIFSPTATTSSGGFISVDSGKFTDASGNVNIDGSDANNILILLRVVTVTTEKHSLAVLVDKGVLGISATLLKGLNESITYTDAIITKHTVEYSGLTFDYSAIDAVITTVTRDDEFTAEFRKELTDFAPTSASLSYKDASLLIGLPNIDNTLIAIAGADGNFVG
jgi:hypothetical protein